MDKIYEDIDEHKSNKHRKILIVFADTISKYSMPFCLISEIIHPR